MPVQCRSKTVIGIKVMQKHGFMQEETSKNAAGASALRRVCKDEQNFFEELAIRTSVAFLTACKGLAIAIEPLAGSLGYSVAQHVAQRRAVGLALLAQIFQPRRIGGQFFHGRHVGLRASPMGRKQ